MSYESHQRANVVICAALIVATIVLLFVNAYMEARAYNRLTGGHATMWDAMFTELRVMGTEAERTTGDTP